MSADNIVVVARFPLRGAEGFQFRVADLGFSGLPFSWSGEPEVKVEDVEYMVDCFACAKVFTDASEASAEERRLLEDYVEYGSSSALFALPWEDYAEQVAAKVAKRKGKPRREKRRRRLEPSERQEHLREFASVIRWHAPGQVFLCCEEQLTPAKLGAHLAYALLKGEPVLLHFVQGNTSWCEGLSAEYVREMLDWVRVHGWFWDEVRAAYSTNSDHAFDSARITPGLYWQQYELLTKQSQALVAQSKALETQHWAGEPERLAAAHLRLTAAAVQNSAQMLLKFGLPTYRKGRRWR